MIAATERVVHPVAGRRPKHAAQERTEETSAAPAIAGAVASRAVAARHAAGTAGHVAVTTASAKCANDRHNQPKDQDDAHRQADPAQQAQDWFEVLLVP